MKFMLGCNYWDSKHGTDMWKYFDTEVIEGDIKALAENGVRFIRCFPNWRDFQPIEKLYEWCMKPKCYVKAETEERPDDISGVDRQQIENFRTFAGICERYGIDLQVAVVTGWMSGRQFVPPAICGKNAITDPEALMLQNRFIREFVNGVKDCKNIVMWCLGNECNCMGRITDRSEAYLWTAFVRNAIHSADPTRPIASGMHSLSADNVGWTIKDQGEICDYMSNHAYVSRSLNNNVDAMNKMRSTIFPTAQCVFYADIGEKPSILEEQGSFSEMLGNREVAVDFMRINMFSSLAHNVKGYLWWCGANHTDLKNPPYTWSMIERNLGLLDNNKQPKPVLREMKKFGEILDKLPFDEVPDRATDAVIMLTDDIDKWGCGAVSFVLAHEAGLDCRFAVSNDPVPDSKLYIVPSITGWSVMHQEAWNGLRERVKNGAVMLISQNGAQLSEFEETTGLTSLGIVRSDKTHKARFDFGELPYKVTSEILLESVGAKVLAKNDEGNIVFSKHSYGKGAVYFLNMPLEAGLVDTAGAFDGTSWYKIYKTVAEEVLAQKVLVSDNPQVFATLHEADDGYYAFALNYSNLEQKCDFKLKDGYRLEVIHGGCDTIGKCDGAIYHIQRV